MTSIYLDNNATTLLDPRVLDSMLEDLMAVGNPSSSHQYGQKAKRQLDKARSTIAAYFSIHPSEIIFTSGGTESLNLILRGIELPLGKNHILTSNVEHASVYQTLEELKEQGNDITYLQATTQGAVELHQIESAIQKNTAMMVFASVNPETGSMIDLEAIASLAQKHDIIFVVDAVAGIGKTKWKPHDGISAFAISGHKFHGPKGVGLAFVKDSLVLKPRITGGSQEKKRRAGTENLPGIIGLSKAIEILSTDLDASIQKMQELRSFFESSILKQIPMVQINAKEPRVCNTSNLFFEGIDAETLLMQLDLQGIAASLGSACSSGSLEPSRVLVHMYDSKRARSSLRFSLSRMTTLEEIEMAVKTICSAVDALEKIHR